MFLDYYAHTLITFVSCDLFDPDMYSEYFMISFIQIYLFSYMYLHYIHKNLMFLFGFWLTNKTMFVIHYKLKNYEIIELKQMTRPKITFAY